MKTSRFIYYAMHFLFAAAATSLICVVATLPHTKEALLSNRYIIATTSFALLCLYQAIKTQQQMALFSSAFASKIATFEVLERS